jgi:hypothetical protein
MDGCETNVTTIDHCNDCNVSCVVPHATSACTSAGCQITQCDLGWGNCTAAPGCETDLTTTLNCGACGRDCPAPGPGATMRGCEMGQCVIAECQMGFGDCDGRYENGCEANLSTNKNHCGTCPNACGMGQKCCAGVCQMGGPC